MPAQGSGQDWQYFNSGSINNSCEPNCRVSTLAGACEANQGCQCVRLRAAACGCVRLRAGLHLWPTWGESEQARGGLAHTAACTKDARCGHVGHVGPQVTFVHLHSKPLQAGPAAFESGFEQWPAASHTAGQSAWQRPTQAHLAPVAPPACATRVAAASWRCAHSAHIIRAGPAVGRRLAGRRPEG